MSASRAVSPGERAALMARAMEVSRNAYCPYSNFAVGAAVLSVSRQVYVGCNVENAAYSPGVCAERNAIGAMVSAGERDALAIAVYTPTQSPTPPCGVCRQVLNEFAPELLVLCGCQTGAEQAVQLTDLLPQAFGPHNLAG